MAESKQRLVGLLLDNIAISRLVLDFYYIGPRHPQAFGKVYKVSGGN